MSKSVRTTEESESGRNESFRDIRTGEGMTRPQFVREIEKGNYPDYHVRVIHGIKTPVSNPDKSEGNNLD